MSFNLHLAEEKVEAVLDTRISALVVGRHLARTLGIWKRAKKVKVRQEDRSILRGNIVVNTTFKVMDSFSVLGKFRMDTGVLNIRNSDMILALSWLTENGFSVDTHDRSLRNVNTRQVMLCSV